MQNSALKEHSHLGFCDSTSAGSLHLVVQITIYLPLKERRNLGTVVPNTIHNKVHLLTSGLLN